jgi:hypothetical protein
MAELLISHQPSSCPTRLSTWAREHQAGLGVNYASELDRHYRPLPPMRVASPD